MIVFPNAKINLGLNVVEKRSDGYHNIETVFYPISLCDGLDVVESDRFEFTLSGMDIQANPENNLVTKAYILLKKEFGLPPIKIHLHKVIPVGAGLGGGSSDGAFMLKLLNELYGLRLEIGQLEKYASILGSDCPFFIRNNPAYATGVGDILTSVKIDLSEYSTILIKPPYSVSTADAYKNVVPSSEKNSIFNILMDSPVSKWKNKLENGLENPVFKMFPEIKLIKEKLYELGALYASMSGSGSSVFGIFSSRPDNPGLYFPNNYFIYL
jgi:4-diphosphocytidyl-2-C-methyl-D-erythritol kinase